VSLDQVGHAVLGTPAVEDLLAGVVRVDDVGPSNVTEISALLQLFSGFTDLVLLGPVLHCVTVVEVGGGAAGGAPPAPALLLHPGTAVGVDLAAD